MIHLVTTWLLVVALAGAGIVNLLGLAGTPKDFARWGYPRGWHRVTGSLELAAAVLIALPGTKIIGLGVGSIVVLAAVATVIHHRDYAHLVPLALFLVLLAFAVY